MKKFRGLVAFVAAVLVGGVTFAQSRKIEVWDFGGVPLSGANNNLTISKIDAIETLPAGGRFNAAGEVSFGNLTLNFVNNDRMYFESNKGKSAGNQGYVSLDFGDGYISNGIYYANGTGGEGRRYMLLNGVKAGDIVTFYAGTSNTSSKNVHFAHVEMRDVKDENIGTVKKQLVKTGLQDEAAPIVQASQANPGRYSYIATADGSYKIYTDPDAGKPVYYRLVHIPGVAISGNLASLPKENAGIKFVCRENGVEIPGKISGSSYSANLAPGFSYTTVLTGIKGYGIDTGKMVDLTKADGGASKTIAMTVVESKTFKVSGELKGFDSKYDVSKLYVVMNPPKNSVSQPVECATSSEGGKLTYSGEIEPDVKYTATLKGANDYSITSDNVYEGTKAFEKDLQVKSKPVYEIKGAFTVVDGKTPALEIPASVKFVNMEDKYEYEGAISGGNYTASLRDGNYEVKSETKNFKTTNHIVVTGKSVSKNINFVAKKADTTEIPLKKDIYVGGSKGEYKTVQEAVNAAAKMNPKEEKDRITIHIAPGVYREQITVVTPYLTFKNDTPAKEVKLTWYYGIGYKYYSSGISGFYDPDLAHDKFSKNGAARWGVSTYIKPTATAFHAEGITFEASFNKYVTEEEIADGVEPDGSLPFTRRINSDVTSKKATERATALCSEADHNEFKNCRMIGSQDTFYTAGGTQYLVNCYIEGQTDFIFGDGDAIFDKCEIRWCGYSSGASSGYITAARNPKKNGYLFSNCIVSGNAKMKVEPGFFGRPWGQGAKVAFIDTVFTNANLLNGVAWTSMSGNTPEKAGFREFNSTCGGAGLDLLERYPPSTMLKSKDGYSVKDFLGDWIPAYYDEKMANDTKFAASVLARNAEEAKKASGKITVFLAGDSTVKDYTEFGMWTGGKALNEGSWGEYLQNFFDKDAVEIQNYAEGGRSTRNFINEGKLDKIAAKIKKGDYLFIQFGHNDANTKDKDRSVPLGTPDKKGIYPVTEGKKSATSPANVAKDGKESYTADCGGTYKWFLKQYIDVARRAGATPVLVTPVSRLYFEADGKIRPHHDADDATEKKNAYCDAVRQLAKQEKVLLIDGFEITKAFYEKAFKEGGSAEAVRPMMVKGDSTHNSKVGGFILAGLFAKEIKSKVKGISKALKKPMNVLGLETNGFVEFMVDGSGNVTAENELMKKYVQATVDAF